MEPADLDLVALVSGFAIFMPFGIIFLVAILFLTFGCGIAALGYRLGSLCLDLGSLG